LSLILEEGLPAEVLRAEIEAIAAAAAVAGVSIVGGDTKVVERGRCDCMYVTTTGLGRLDDRGRLHPPALRPGDRNLVSGHVGEHGIAIMLARGEFELAAEVRSDTRSLWPAVDALLEAAGPSLRCVRDATRGGVASVLNELVHASGVAAVVREAAVPIAAPVVGACEILGIDPLYVANEGVLVAFVAPEAADAALAVLRGAGGCKHAAEIGVVKSEPPGLGPLEAAFGGRRGRGGEDLLMQELALAEAVVSIAERHADGRRVARVDLAVGRLRQVVVDALAFSFDLVAQGTRVEGAELHVEEVPILIACDECVA